MHQVKNKTEIQSVFGESWGYQWLVLAGERHVNEEEGIVCSDRHARLLFWV